MILATKMEYLINKILFVIENLYVFLEVLLYKLQDLKFWVTKYLDPASIFVPRTDYLFSIFLWRCSPTRARASSYHEISRSHTTTHHSRWDSSGRVISSSQRPLPDNTQHNNRPTSMPPVGFEPTISAGERPQTYALDRAATGTGIYLLLV